jgi:2-polyprenyl-3-methyl-5-hydroxy-6-metoxy-1,4-benzoquinol methylase
MGQPRLFVAPRFSWRRLFGAIALTVFVWSGATPGFAQDSSPIETDVEQSSPDASADQPETRDRQVYMGRTIAPTMHFSGAGWLTRPTREQEEEPLKLLNSLKIKPGMTICDFGCGNGFHSLQMAKRVGPSGKIDAIDIQPEMLEMLQERAGPRGLANIKPILATEDESGLSPGAYDMVLMVDVYHELSNPAEILTEVRKSLKPDGRLVLVEFREEDESVPILPLHKMSQVQVLKELEANGFKLVDQFDRLPWQHVLHFCRDDSKTPEAELVPWRP